MTLKKRLSVIIPTYDRESVLSRAVRSVLSQVLIDEGDVSVEVIIIDDGSTDNTAQLIADEFPEVTYHYQPNQGVSAARNKGFELASGEWLALLDSDDEWLPNKLTSQFDLLAETDLFVCHTQEIWIRNGVRVNQMKKHKKEGGWIFEKCLPLCAMSPSSILFHRSVIDQVGGFDEALPACEDYDLWLRISANYEVAFLGTPQINKYGGHDDQLSRQFWGMDRFRVIALEKILQTDLSETNRLAAKSMLITKLEILALGATKRKNHALLEDCNAKLVKWR